MTGHDFRSRGLPSSLRWLLITLFLLWLIFVLSSFFVVNKPFRPAFGQQLSDALQSVGFSTAAATRTFLDLAATLWLAFAALGVGLWGWRRLGLATDDAGSATVLSMGLGFGMLGMLTLLMGLGGLLARPLLVAVLLVLTLVTAPGALTLLRGMARPRSPRLIAVYLLLVLGLSLALALLPPTSWDALFYHLKGPKIYLQAGQIQPGLDIPHLNFPPLFDMLFLLGIGIRGDITAKLVHFAFALLLGGLVYLSATRLLRLRHGWTAVVFLYATPLVPTLAAWAYNDLALSFYGLAALYAFLLWHRNENARWLLLSGLFAGMMMSIKYTAFVTPLLLVALLLWRYRRDPRAALRPFLHFALPAALLVLPWLLKNWAFTGNPVYPFLFGGRFWDEFRAAAYSNSGSGIGFDPVALLRLPYDMTLGYADASQEGTVGPLYLIFLPLLVAYAVMRKLSRDGPAGGTEKDRGPHSHASEALNIVLLYAATAFAFWTVGVIYSRGLWQARLLLPGLVVLCPAMAWVLDDLRRFDRPHFSLQRFLRLTLVFVLALLLLDQVGRWLEINPVAFLSGNESRQVYLQRQLGPHYVVMAALNEQLPADAVVTFLWEPRSYYCDSDCRPDAILDRFNHLEHLHDDAATIAAHWQREGVTHVLIYDAGLNFVLDTYTPLVTPEDLATLRALQTEHLEPEAVWEGAYTLYALKEVETVEP